MNKLCIFLLLAFPGKLCSQVKSMPAAKDDALFGAPKGWPEALPFPKGMASYSPAKYTQRIAVTDERDSITPVPRAATEAKWRVPGGLLGLRGWRSDLYKHVPSPPQVWVGNVSVWNGASFQDNRGWKRSYASGTFFCDVLSANGKVFEVRYRTKIDGKWESDVAFRDPSAAPAGYVRIKSNQCATCHNDANGPGTGSYGTGLVAGGDTIFSDPFERLER